MKTQKETKILRKLYSVSDFGKFFSVWQK